MSVQGFMGLVVLPGKTYTQIVSAPFRLSMAALDEEVKDKKRTTVTVTVDKKEYVLCTLVAEKIEQQPLDITFVEGEEITFAVKGDNIVHLTGNYVFNDDDEEIVSGSEDESDSGEESFDEEEFMKNLPEGVTEAEVRALLAQQGESGDEIESDEELDSDIEEEIEEEEVEPVKTKKRAAEVIKEQPSKKQKAEAKKEEAKKVETKKEEPKKVEAKKVEAKKVEAKKVEAKKVEAKKEEPKKVEPKKEEPKKKEAKKEEKKVTKLPNGLIIEEVKLGEGASCKSGQRVGMRYIGKLTNGKVFDKNTSGKPFSFLLGRGEVIKGWDIGVAGMKAGGERKLTIPAPLAYGKRGAPPDIPKNATLVFDIRLVSMK